MKEASIGNALFVLVQEYVPVGRLDSVVIVERERVCKPRTENGWTRGHQDWMKGEERKTYMAQNSVKVKSSILSTNETSRSSLFFFSRQRRDARRNDQQRTYWLRLFIIASTPTAIQRDAEVNQDLTHIRRMGRRRFRV